MSDRFFSGVIVASARGYYLRSWRYGPECEQLIEKALDRETWNKERWKNWQEEKLAYLLHRAATQVPYYKNQWDERRRNGDSTSWEYLENWPILEKEPLRIHSKAFVASDHDIRKMFHEHTSGTTGKSLDLWWSRTTVREWYALVEARSRKWYGVTRKNRWAILGGQLVIPVKEKKPPFWVWNHGLNQLYMSSYHLSPDNIPAYLDAIKTFNIHYLWGYTSSLYALALELVKIKRNDLRMAVIVANAEPVYSYQRDVIEEAFQCPLRETYGMAEIVSAASECEFGNLHLWPEIGKVEIEKNSQDSGNSEIGDLICTGLLNTDMPLIRYRVGDVGEKSRSTQKCPCNRTLPILSKIEGRVDDVLFTPEGRYVGRLDPVFKSQLPICEAQIIQETYNLVRVRYVPAPTYTSATGLSIANRLKERLGPIEVILEPVQEIPRGANGKFRAVISKVSHDQQCMDEGK